MVAGPLIYRDCRLGNARAPPRVLGIVMPPMHRATARCTAHHGHLTWLPVHAITPLLARRTSSPLLRTPRVGGRLHPNPRNLVLCTHPPTTDERAPNRLSRILSNFVHAEGDGESGICHSVSLFPYF